MASNQKALREELKAKYVTKITDFLGSSEEILRTASNEFAFPVVDSEGNEEFIVVVVKIPTGGRDGEPYDGYCAAEDYRMKCEAKAAKAEEKKRKAEADKAKRERKKKTEE